MYYWLVVLLGIAQSGGRAEQQRILLSENPHLISSASQGWGEMGLGVSAHAPGQTPLEMSIGGKRFLSGLGTHAPGEIVLELDGQFERFTAMVGVQDQPSGEGSVVFRVMDGDRTLFDSKLVRGGYTAKRVDVSVSGLDELRLVVTDGGDGITCDCANWAEAALVPAPSAKATGAEPEVDVARFGMLCTSDPARMDGARANRVQAFRAEDLYLDERLERDEGGSYTIQPNGGKGAVGLVWLERRRLRQVGIEWAGDPPDLAGSELQAWDGKTLWQGRWAKVQGEIRQRGKIWTLSVDAATNPLLWQGTRKVRWAVPAESGLEIAGLSAKTRSRWQQVKLRLQAAKPGNWELGTYNCEISGIGGPVAWDAGEPLDVEVLAVRPRAGHPDRSVLMVSSEGKSFALAVDDVVRTGAVYVPEAGLLVTTADSKDTLESYRRKIAGSKTVLERVRGMDEQTFGRALERTHRDWQNNGPTMLSLACCNSKFILSQEGALEHGGVTVSASGGNLQSRGLVGGWKPIVRNSAEQYTQTTFVAPGSGRSVPGSYEWLDEQPLGVSVFEIRPGDVDFTLGVSGGDGPAVQVTQSTGCVKIVRGDELAAYIDTSNLGGLVVETSAEQVRVSGTLPEVPKASVTLFVPGWKCQGGWTPDTAADVLRKRTEEYWEGVIGRGAFVHVPDPLLDNVIKASQVHCLIAARNEDSGGLAAPWAASMSYGPLESESHSIIRGMDLLGHREFAQRSLEYFISRYDDKGMLTTGYTLNGNGWHLQTLGQSYLLNRDEQWLGKVADKVSLACKWMAEQRDKTVQPKLSSGRPEEGLVPPGVLADWDNFAYHFALNGYYYAGLDLAGQALADIGRLEAAEFESTAAQLKKSILDAYAWTKARTPVLEMPGGYFVSAYPSQVHSPGPLADFFPGEDANRSWCYDVELGAHHLVHQGVIDPDSEECGRICDHMEDVQFLADGWFDYSSEENHRDWFDLGGFSKVQPYYTRNFEIYAMRGDRKPFIRSYFNSLASLLNLENLSLWEHFHNAGAWNKTHETGYFLQQTRFMLAMERDGDLWLAPFVPSEWIGKGKEVEVRGLPTHWGPVSYRISSEGTGTAEALADLSELRAAPERVMFVIPSLIGTKGAAVKLDEKPTAYDPDTGAVDLGTERGRRRITVRL